MQYAVSYMRKIIRNGSTTSLTTINEEFQLPPSSSSSPGSFKIFNTSGNVIAQFSLQSASVNGIQSSYIEYSPNSANSNSIEITAPSQLNITKLDFYYYNYDLTGSSGNKFTPKIPPYVTIYMQGCTLHKFGLYGNYLCVNLISSATLENYVYAKQ